MLTFEIIQIGFSRAKVRCVVKWLISECGLSELAIPHAEQSPDLLGSNGYIGNVTQEDIKDLEEEMGHCETRNSALRWKCFGQELKLAEQEETIAHLKKQLGVDDAAADFGVMYCR